VLYLGETAWADLRERLVRLHVVPVTSHNPYWDRNGLTIVDPDGNRLVFNRGPWRRPSLPRASMLDSPRSPMPPPTTDQGTSGIGGRAKTLGANPDRQSASRAVPGV
jgi:hypothetical protein